MDITEKVLAAVADGSGHLAIFRDLYLLGLVRIRLERDTTNNFQDLCGDCYSPTANPEIDPAQLKREKDNFRRRVNREGVHGAIIEVRQFPNEEWADLPGDSVSSIWGFVGFDFIGSGYEADMIRAAVDWAKDNVAPEIFVKRAELIRELFQHLAEAGVN